MKYKCKVYYEDMDKEEIKFTEAEIISDPKVVNYSNRIKKKRRVIFVAVTSAITLLLAVVAFMFYLIIDGGPVRRTSDVKDYGVFEDFKGYSNLYIFPKVLPKTAEIESYDYYYQDIFLDSTCQIFLEYSLSQEDFNKEVLRLSNISETFDNKVYKDIENNIVYNTESFNYPAYITVFNNNHTYEYALINEKEHKIICVFLQFVKFRDVKFDENYLSFGYKDGDDRKGYNIYYTEQSTGYFERHER